MGKRGNWVDFITNRSGGYRGAIRWTRKSALQSPGIDRPANRPSCV